MNPDIALPVLVEVVLLDLCATESAQCNTDISPPGFCLRWLCLMAMAAVVLDLRLVRAVAGNDREVQLVFEIRSLTGRINYSAEIHH